MKKEEWLSLGLVSGEQVICGNCAKAIKGGNDTEHGKVFLKILPPLTEIAQVWCEACYTKEVNKICR